MSSTRGPSSPSRRAVFTAVMCALVPGVQAQQASNDSQALDHRIVVSRTVQARVAYRGIALDDNPVRVQARTFPSRVFQETLDASMERLVGDGELAHFGSIGIDRHAALHFAPLAGRPGAPTPLMLGGAGSASATPLGSGASAGGAVSAATRDLGNLVLGSLAQGNLLPALGTGSGGGE